MRLTNIDGVNVTYYTNGTDQYPLVEMQPANYSFIRNRERQARWDDAQREWSAPVTEFHWCLDEETNKDPEIKFIPLRTTDEGKFLEYLQRKLERDVGVPVELIKLVEDAQIKIAKGMSAFHRTGRIQHEHPNDHVDDSLRYAVHTEEAEEKKPSEFLSFLFDEESKEK